MISSVYQEHPDLVGLNPMYRTVAQVNSWASSGADHLLDGQAEATNDLLVGDNLLAVGVLDENRVSGTVDRDSV